jgi:hypothetical protein
MHPLQPSQPFCEAYTCRSMAEEEEDLLEFLDKLAESEASLAPKACAQSSTLSCLDLSGPEPTSQLQPKHTPTIEDVRQVHEHAQPRPTPKLIRTPDQVLQQLFQRPYRALSQPLPTALVWPCTAIPPHTTARLKCETFSTGLVPIPEAPSQLGERCSTHVKARLSIPCRDGETSLAPFLVRHI